MRAAYNSYLDGNIHYVKMGSVTGSPTDTVVDMLSGVGYYLDLALTGTDSGQIVYGAVNVSKFASCNDGTCSAPVETILPASQGSSDSIILAGTTAYIANAQYISTPGILYTEISLPSTIVNQNVLSASGGYLVAIALQNNGNPYVLAGVDTVSDLNLFQFQDTNGYGYGIGSISKAVGPVISTQLLQVNPDGSFATPFIGVPNLIPSLTFSLLSSSAPNGTLIYCSDCRNVTDDTTGIFDSAAASGGHGTNVLRENGAWRVH